MSTISPHRSIIPPSGNGLPLLCNGDRMKQPEFHKRYEAYPEDMKFELVGGVVYMESPRSTCSHGVYHGELSLVLGYYQAGHARR